MINYLTPNSIRRSAWIAYSSKSDEIETEAKLDEIEGQTWKCVLRYTDFLFVRSRKNQKVRVPEYTFSLLPLNIVQFGIVTSLVRFLFFVRLNKVVERTVGQADCVRLPNKRSDRFSSYDKRTGISP